MIFTHFSLGLFANNLCSKLKTILCGKEIKIGNRIKTTKRKKKLFQRQEKLLEEKNTILIFFLKKNFFETHLKRKQLKGPKIK